MSSGIWLALALVAVGAAVARILTLLVRERRRLGTPADKATFRTLHAASLASPLLRAGLSQTSAERSLKYLRTLLGSRTIALTDCNGVLAWDGAGDHHRVDAVPLATLVIEKGSTHAYGPSEVRCADVNCPLRHCVVAPLTIEDRVVGTLQVYAPSVSAGLIRATTEVARWVSGQLELAELDRSRSQMIEAEMRALRAQISPHFIYNSLTAIASFVRTDPERARELLLEFADFTRYSLRRHGDFTTLAEELRSIERYLVLEKARFGERLQVTLQVAPEVLPVTLPFLCLQPLVENAVRHGIERKPESGRITIVAEDATHEAIISVEDDGVGDDPERVRRSLAGEPESDAIGLGNVDERLRTVFGDGYGLVVETAPGAGTKVTIRVPKFAPGLRAH